MQRVTLREYAKKHKLSFFNVLKMVKGGDLKSESVIENGKEVFYVLIDEAIEKEISQKIIPNSHGKLTLQEENQWLKAELARLKEKLEACEKSKDK